MGVLERDGCPLAFEVSGSGPPILFVQGTGVHGGGWRPQVEAFGREHICIRFDHRGVGRSRPRGAQPSVERMARDGLAVLAAASAEPAHVVGHSLGGLVALQLALLEPARVRSLALLCTFGDGRAPARGARMLWIGARTRIGTARMRRHAFLELVLAPAEWRAADRDALARELAPLYGHDLARQPGVAMAQIAGMRRCDLSARLPELGRLPTLVLSAAHDLIAPPALGRALAAGIPGARYAELPDAAHGAPITHAAQVNELLRVHFGTPGGKP